MSFHHAKGSERFAKRRRYQSVRRSATRRRAVAYEFSGDYTGSLQSPHMSKIAEESSSI
jgi:hypothetical protein